MTPNHSGRRLLLLVAASIALLVAGTGAAVACDTCADPNQDDDEYEPFYSNEEFPYDTSENRSFVGIVVNETEEEMAEDFGGENDSREASAGASAGSASVGARATVDVPWTTATSGDARGSAAVEVDTAGGG